MRSSGNSGCSGSAQTDAGGVCRRDSTIYMQLSCFIKVGSIVCSDLSAEFYSLGRSHSSTSLVLAIDIDRSFAEAANIAQCVGKRHCERRNSFRGDVDDRA